MCFGEKARVQLETPKHLYFFDHGLREQSLSDTQRDDQTRGHGRTKTMVIMVSRRY